MPETNLNPFTSSSTASAYAGADPVYVASAEAAVEFVLPSAELIADLGAGTGVSSEVILRKLFELNPYASLTLIEPSKPMLEHAQARLAGAVHYLNLAVDQLISDSFDLIYALNCFHLFPDHNSAAMTISKALRPEGVFVFNLSSPTYRFTELSEDELDCLYANLDFYAELHAATGGTFAVITTTVQLLANLITAIEQGTAEPMQRSSRGLYSQTELANIFKTASMDLVDYTEVVIRVPADYQRNIWRMMAKSFIHDERVVTELIAKIAIPEIVPIRQALFKLCKH